MNNLGVEEGFALWKECRSRTGYPLHDALSVCIGVRNACFTTSRQYLGMMEVPLFREYFDIVPVAGEEMLKNGKVPNHFIIRKGISLAPFIKRKEGDILVLKDPEVSIGKIIGFPPTEAENFRTIKERVFVHYHGYFTFACEFNRLEQTLHYMKQSTPVPEGTPGSRPTCISTLYPVHKRGRETNESISLRPEVIQAMTWEEVQWWCQEVKTLREKKRGIA